MGKRVHVAKKYEVEYGSTESFNYKDDKFYDILLMLGAEPNNVGAPDDTMSDIFECPVNDYRDALENLKVHIESPEVYQPEDHEEIVEAAREAGHTLESLLDVMQRYYDEADKRDGWLHFASW